MDPTTAGLVCAYLKKYQAHSQSSQGAPSVSLDKALLRAVQNGYIDLIHVLLADPRMDPSANNNRALQLAAQNGQEEATRVLLADPRVNPYNRALQQVLQRDQMDAISSSDPKHQRYS